LNKDTSRGETLQQLNDEALLTLATKLEGHPDNVAAALFGGATVSWQETLHGHKVAHAIKISVDSRISAFALIPAHSVSTSKARKLLPESIPHAEAVLNSTHTALLVHALSTRPDLLLTATEDFLHQKYRRDVMPQSFALVSKLREEGMAAFISGAGPTVLVLHTGDQEDIAELQRLAGVEFSLTPLSITNTGASVISS